VRSKTRFSIIRALTICAWAGTCSLTATASATTIDVYRDPNCGCCFKWIAYLKNNGYQVNDHLESDMHGFKQTQKIPDQLTSCHTGVINGKFIEGHVPVEQIVLLERRDDLRGIAAPGMPAGSPGMERGAVRDAHQILGLTTGGDVEVVARYEAH
jgi:hypothetical protein